MATTTTARSKKYLEGLGYVVGTVERWVPQAKRRIDLLGFIDLVAVGGPDDATIGVQSTSGAHTAERATKIKEEAGANALLWLQCGNRIEVHGWRKLKRKRLGKQMYWAVKVQEITLADFPDAPGPGLVGGVPVP